MSRSKREKRRWFLAGSAFFAAFLVVLAPAAPCRGDAPGVGRSETIAAKKGTARSIAELARMYDSGGCAECHRAIYDEWRRSPHSDPILGGGRTGAAFRTAILEGISRWPYSGVKGDGDVKVAHLMECAKCHLPQLADAGDEAAREIAAALADWQKARNDNDAATTTRAAAKLAGLDIGCLVCHNRNAVIHKWADGYPKAGEVYGSKEGTHNDKAFPVLRKSPVLREAILCGQCHGLGPNLDLENPTQCSSIYGGYLFAYKAHGGRETCQDCHMRKNKLGHDLRVSADPGAGKAALDVSAEARGYQWRNLDEYVGRVVVEVTMTNKTGHSIPGSASTGKRLVLEVKGRAANGAELFSRSKSYMTVPQKLGRGDRTGRGPYEDSGIVEDTALPAHKTVRERYEISLDPAPGGKDAGSRPPVEVTVDVKVRLAGPGAGTAAGSPWYEFTKVVKIEP